MSQCVLDNAAEWRYRAEGGANTVYEYTGASSEMSGLLLRVPKDAHAFSATQILDFQRNVIAPLIGAEYISPYRPTEGNTLLMEDLTQSCAIAIEWKPKSALDDARAGICCHFCAFNKGAAAKFPRSNPYCPREMFSRDADHVHRAARALLAVPEGSPYCRVWRGPSGAATTALGPDLVATLLARAVIAERALLARLAALQARFHRDIRTLRPPPQQRDRVLDWSLFIGDDGGEPDNLLSYCMYKTLADLSVIFRFQTHGGALSAETAVYERAFVIDADPKSPRKLAQWQAQHEQLD